MYCDQFICSASDARNRKVLQPTAIEIYAKYVVSWQDLCERSTFNMEAGQHFFYGKTGPVTMR